MNHPHDPNTEDQGWGCEVLTWRRQPDGRWFCPQTLEWRDTIALSGTWDEVAVVDAPYSKPDAAVTRSLPEPMR